MAKVEEVRSETYVSPEEVHDRLLHLMDGVNAQVFEQHGTKVEDGPFKGMEIPEVTPWRDGNSGAKLLGTYEFELHGVIDRALNRKPKAIVNLGCAEGYYAIGLARAAPHALVYAIDKNQESIDILEKYAKINGVYDHIQSWAEEFVDPSELDFDTGGHTLYVIDTEGKEADLVDVEKCPALATSDLIIECHDFFCTEGTISGYLAYKLQDTHDIEIIDPKVLLPNQYPHSGSLVILLLAITEKRPVPTCWLACWAKKREE